MLDQKLKKVIQWTLFVLITIIFLTVVLIPIIFTIYLPDSELAKNTPTVISIASGLIGFLSAILGFISIFQASSSSKQVEKILGELKSLADSQKLMFKFISENATSNEHGKTVSFTDDDWPEDDVH